MRSLRYLNTILTILTVLLALQLWTTWTTGAGGSPLTTAEPAHASGIANAGHQRQQMIVQLKQLSRQAEELAGLFKSGQARVRLEARPN